MNRYFKEQFSVLVLSQIWQALLSQLYNKRLQEADNATHLPIQHPVSDPRFLLNFPRLLGTIQQLPCNNTNNLGTVYLLLNTFFIHSLRTRGITSIEHRAQIHRLTCDL